jgi:hypothetical protein
VYGYTVSSWYDPIKDCAFTTTNYADVPVEFRSSLVQHSTGTTGASIIYPNLEPAISTMTDSKKFSFPNHPTFVGDQYQVFWDVGRDDTALSIYNATSPISSLCHTYRDYGEHSIKFSSNVIGLKLKSYFE